MTQNAAHARAECRLTRSKTIPRIERVRGGVVGGRFGDKEKTSFGPFAQGAGQSAAGYLCMMARYL